MSIQDEYLKEEIKRLETIEKYGMKMEEAKNDKKREYYKEGMEYLFSPGETIDNYEGVLNDYRQAYRNRTQMVGKLYNEIDIIKHLKILRPACGESLNLLFQICWSLRETALNMKCKCSSAPSLTT